MKTMWRIAWVTFFAGVFLLTCYSFFMEGYEEGQKDALRGLQKYQMDITYQQINVDTGDDSIFIMFTPVDTTYKRIK